VLGLDLENPSHKLKAHNRRVKKDSEFDVDEILVSRLTAYMDAEMAKELFKRLQRLLS